MKAVVAAALPKAELAPQQRSTIEVWPPQIHQLMVEHGMAPKAIWRRLRERHGDTFDDSYAQVKRLCRPLRRERGVQPEDVPIVVATALGWSVAAQEAGTVAAPAMRDMPTWRLASLTCLRHLRLAASRPRSF